MKRFHVHVSVQDLGASVRFYSKLFGAEPTVAKTDYAKWMLEDPRVNFAISQRDRKPGINHLGFQVDSASELATLREQAERADMAAVDEPGAACCYARSDKHWIEDPQPFTRLLTFRFSVIRPQWPRRRLQCAVRPRPSPKQRNAVDDASVHRRPSSSVFMSQIMSAPRYNILFLCTGNSARSILAEAIANHLAVGNRFAAYSAGSQPRGAVNPAALELLERKGISTAGLRSKSWDEFAAADAPRLDFVITVCDQAAGEQCPYWPGQPMTAHWGMPDPAAVQGTPDEVRKAFADTFTALRRRIDLLANLPIDTLDRMALQERIKGIGRE
jgi:arsenate reductase